MQTAKASRKQSSLSGQGASRAAPGKSGLHARGEGERVLALESREGASSSGLSTGGGSANGTTDCCMCACSPPLSGKQEFSDFLKTYLYFTICFNIIAVSVGLMRGPATESVVAHC